jgi:hypothetical protein
MIIRPHFEWKKSSRSMAGDNNCVEVALAPDSNSLVAVRNSRDPEGGILYFTLDEWRAFASGVKDGEFDFAA